MSLSFLSRKPRLKIAILLPLLTLRRGATRFVVEIAKELKARGHAVSTACLLCRLDEVFEEVNTLNPCSVLSSEGSLTKVTNSLVRVSLRHCKRMPNIMGVSVSVFVSFLLAFMAIIKWRPNVIVVNSGYTFMGLLQSIFRKTKFILYYHGFHLDTGARTILSRFLRYFEKFSISTCSFVTNSSHSAKLFEKAVNVRPHVVYPGVDVGRFGSVVSTRRNQALLYVGVFAPYRKQDFLIRLLPSIQRSVKVNVKLLLVGALENESRDWYRRLVEITRKLRLCSSVRLFTNVSDEELLRLYASATIFLNPIEEGFGLNVVEALAAGLPVILYESGGQLDMITHGTHGFIAGDNPEEWVGYAVRLLTDKELYRKMRETARRRAKDFSWTKAVDKLEYLATH